MMLFFLKKIFLLVFTERGRRASPGGRACPIALKTMLEKHRLAKRWKSVGTRVLGEEQQHEQRPACSLEDLRSVAVQGWGEEAGRVIRTG